MDDYIDQFINDVCAGKTNETPRAYRAKLRQFKNHLDGAEINQETVNLFRTCLLSRAEKRRGGSMVPGGLSVFTVRSVLTTVRHFIRWGAARGLWSPVELQNVREPKPEPKAITNDCFDALLEAATVTGAPWEQSRNIALLYVLRDTGGRAGCISRIELSNIDMETGEVWATDKGGISYLEFNEPTIAAVKEWLQFRAEFARDDRLFTGRRGYGISRQGIDRVLRRLAIAGGVNHLRHNAHSFRHAFARDVIQAGADLSQTSQLLGHSSIVVTAKYYARWDRRELKRAHRRYSPGRLLKPPKRRNCKTLIVGSNLTVASIVSDE